MRRKWTDDDVNSLCEMWGNSSVERICTKLERSKSSVIQKVNRLKLGAFLDNSIYITKHQLLVALGINSDSYKNVSWLKNRGCKAKENGCDECLSFVRLKPQFCKRCGKDFIEHGEHLYCQNCREARLKQAQRKYAILNQKGEL